MGVCSDQNTHYYLRKGSLKEILCVHTIVETKCIITNEHFHRYTHCCKAGEFWKTWVDFGAVAIIQKQSVALYKKSVLTVNLLQNLQAYSPTRYNLTCYNAFHILSHKQTREISIIASNNK